MTEQPYNLNKNPDSLLWDVKRRIEDQLQRNGVSVEFDNLPAVEQLIDQYNAELTKANEEIEVKRYLLFVFPAGRSMYDAQPAGGWHDFVGSYDSVHACQDAILDGTYERKNSDEHEAQVVDIETGKIVLTGEGEYELGVGFGWLWKPVEA